MRLLSPLNLIIFIVIWTAVFILLARYFLYSAHQTWFKDEEQKLLASVEFKIDNLDARNMRQLNQLYSEIKALQNMFTELRREIHVDGSNRSVSMKVKRNPVVGASPMTSIEPTMAVLVIACNRVDYTRQTLDELLKHRPSAGLFPIIVSQDCGHQPTADVIAGYGTRITHIKHPDLSGIEIPAKDRKIKNKLAETGYYKIARHYKWALTQVFEEMNHDYVIIVEDDLIIAPDFYMYFSALWPLLNSDPTVMCVSAYNDNGKSGYINMQENDKLYRTDFFPGLGWMMNKKLWLELKPKWPLTFWDDWLREPEQRKDRVCIRPEVSRTKTVGKKGVSHGTYFTKYLQFIVLNSNPVDFMKKNLTYLKKEIYDKDFIGAIHLLPVVSVQEVINGASAEEVRVQYSSNKEFERMANQLKIMSDLRSGIPRTAYHGIVSFMYKNKRVHLVPTSWHGYS